MILSFVRLHEISSRIIALFKISCYEEIVVLLLEAFSLEKFDELRVAFNKYFNFIFSSVFLAQRVIIYDAYSWDNGS